MEKTYFVDPYKIMRGISSKIPTNPDRKTHTLTLEQLKNMNLSPFLEHAYFGRTSEEWEKELNRTK